MNRPRIYLGVIILLAVILAGSAASYFRLLDRYELILLDIRFKFRAKTPASDKIALIGIDENTIKHLGSYPFDRGNHAVLVNALSEFGAKAVLFDIFLSAPDLGDSQFEEALRVTGSVYLPVYFNFKTGASAIPSSDVIADRCLDSFTAFARGIGHVNVAVDIDGKCRRFPPYIQYRNTFFPQIAVLAACDYLGIKKKDIDLLPGGYLACGAGLKIPLDENSFMFIDHPGEWQEDFKRYSYFDVLQSYFAKRAQKAPVLDPALFKDKICIVSQSWAPSGDGVCVKALNAIISKRFIARASKDMNLAALAVVGLFVAGTTFALRPLKGLFILVALTAIYIFGAIYLFNTCGLWADMVAPIAVMISMYTGFLLLKVGRNG